MQLNFNMERMKIHCQNGYFVKCTLALARNEMNVEQSQSIFTIFINMLSSFHCTKIYSNNYFAGDLVHFYAFLDSNDFLLFFIRFYSIYATDPMYFEIFLSFFCFNFFRFVSFPTHFYATCYMPD